MTKYDVHLYREMQLDFAGIEAKSPGAAAVIASEKHTSEADNIEDCNGENLAALVDVDGDEDFGRSVTIDFEGERRRKAAAALLAALERIIVYAESEASYLDSLEDSPETEVLARRAWQAVEAARAAMALATDPDGPGGGDPNGSCPGGRRGGVGD